MRRLVWVLLWCSAAVLAQDITSEKARFRVTGVASGLDHPWSLAFLPDGTCW